MYLSLVERRGGIILGRRSHCPSTKAQGAHDGAVPFLAVFRSDCSASGSALVVVVSGNLNPYLFDSYHPHIPDDQQGWATHAPVGSGRPLNQQAFPPDIPDADMLNPTVSWGCLP